MTQQPNINELREAIQPKLNKCPACGSFAVLGTKARWGRQTFAPLELKIQCLKRNCIATKLITVKKDTFDADIESLIHLWNVLVPVDYAARIEELHKLKTIIESSKTN